MQSEMPFSAALRAESSTGTWAEAAGASARRRIGARMILSRMGRLPRLLVPTAKERQPILRIVANSSAQFPQFIDAVDIAGQDFHQIRHVRQIESGDHGIMVVLDQELAGIGMGVDDPFEFPLAELEPADIA